MGIITLEKGCLVEFTNSFSYIDDLVQLCDRYYIFFYCTRGAVVISGQIGSYTSYGPQKQNCVEVDVLKALRVGSNAGYETFKIGTLYCVEHD